MDVIKQTQRLKETSGFPTSLECTFACWLISPWTKWPSFRRRHFQAYFLKWKCWNSDLILTEICSSVSSWQYISSGSGNGLSPVRYQAITWLNADPRIYAALGGKWVNSFFCQSLTDLGLGPRVSHHCASRCPSIIKSITDTMLTMLNFLLVVLNMLQSLSLLLKTALIQRWYEFSLYIETVCLTAILFL